MGLKAYHKKRDFKQTPEPKGKLAARNQHRFVVQEHHASKLHFDFRLEMGGILKSWSVPKGPSLDPREKRLAVETEDHPIEYLKFEGRIPDGHYGAGEHLIWDTGTYELKSPDEGESHAGPLKQLEKGKLTFQLHGDKLHGAFNLIRLGGRKNQWLLIKSKDEFAEPGWELELLLETDQKRAQSQKRRGTKERKRTPQQEVKRSSTRAKKADGRVIPASQAFKSKELSGDLQVKVGQHLVSLTNLDKLYWPDDGYTKGDLIKYYYDISKYILPYLKDRPLIMKRYPHGINEPSFHQHDVDEAPDYVETAAIDVEEGHVVDYIVGGDLATLLYMANLGAIECHPWHSRVQSLDRPDWFVLDLDPGEGIQYSAICEVALSVRAVLEGLGLEGYAKTSGSRGMHVYVPLKPMHSYQEVAAFAEQIATLVAKEKPEMATVERSLKKRKRGQIYVDHLQNARGKSVVAPYSVRPREGATVSAPLDWAEVKRRKITPQDFTIKNMLARVDKKGDLFKPVLSRKQSLTQAIEKVKNLLKSPKVKRAGA